LREGNIWRGKWKRGITSVRHHREKNFILPKSGVKAKSIGAEG